MKIEMYEIPVRDIFDGYEDLSDQEGGVYALGGRLTCRPAYQREFIYKEKERNDVIHTLRHGFPLNVMYWVRTDAHEEDIPENETQEEKNVRKANVIKNGKFEILDGQQRTLSIMQFLNHDFHLDWDGNEMFIHNVKNSFPDKYEEMLDYKLSVYICVGSQSEVLEWFKVINIAGAKLFDQELRNAIYTGSWLADAKKYFSKTNCAAYKLAHKYLTGSPIRQDYLQTALSWICNRDGGTIEEYMAKNQDQPNCNELWLYFTSVINWLEALFPKRYYRPIMKGQPWGELYNRYNQYSYDADELEEKVKELLLDDEVGNSKGIYQYIFSLSDSKYGNEKLLQLRKFSEKDKLAQYEKQQGICKMCGQHFEYDEMEGDHIIPWHDGGKTEKSNLQMLCKHCNRTKSGS